MSSMTFTTAQAADFLGVSEYRLAALVKEGKIINRAVKKEGQKKAYGKYLLSDLKKFKAENKQALPSPIRVSLGRVSDPSNHSSASNIPSRLERIEQKLDRLLALWS